MNLNHRHDRARSSSSENTTRRIHAVGAVEPTRHSQRAAPAPHRANPAPHRANPPPQRAIIVCDRRYFRVEVEEVEAAQAEYKVVKALQDSMVRKERKAMIRFEQVESQLRRAGRSFARGLLPFGERPPLRPLDRNVFTVEVDQSRRRMQEATVPVKVDQLRAALIRLRMTEEELDILSSNERELRINIAQAGDQLLRARITPSQGLLPYSSSTSRRTHQNR